MRSGLRCSAVWKALGSGGPRSKARAWSPRMSRHGSWSGGAKGVTRRLIDGVIKDPDIEGHAHAIASWRCCPPGHSLRDWPPGRSPFPGLQAFTKDYAPVYCGRDAEVRALVDEIRAMRERRFLAVIGASGCGKSSMVRAGVVPALEAEGWLTVTCRPAEARKDPFLSLAMGLRVGAVPRLGPGSGSRRSGGGTPAQKKKRRTCRLC